MKWIRTADIVLFLKQVSKEKLEANERRIGAATIVGTATLVKKILKKVITPKNLDNSQIEL